MCRDLNCQPGDPIEWTRPPAPPAAADVRFEVAAVKRNRSGESNGRLRGEPGGRVNAVTMPLGNWDFELACAPDSLRRPAPGAEPPPVNLDASSVFAVLQEQLGLKLEPATGPVDVLVIDSVERPIAD